MIPGGIDVAAGLLNRALVNPSIFGSDFAKVSLHLSSLFEKGTYHVR